MGGGVAHCPGRGRGLPLVLTGESYPWTGQVYPCPPSERRVSDTTRQVVHLLRSRRRTFLYYIVCNAVHELRTRDSGCISLDYIMAKLISSVVILRCHCR